jgi:PIN domain nuclease of toxin-antitoxin system
VTRVVADSHAIHRYVQGSDRLSDDAASAFEAGGGIVVSVATIVDLWYVTQTTEGVTPYDLTRLRDVLTESASVDLPPIDVSVADATTEISRELLADPWDRFIVATPAALEVPLVTRDRAIINAALDQTIW